jgi:hypothetical protein
MNNEQVPGVPTGSYCYGYVPTPGGGFKTDREAYDYLYKKYGDKISAEHFDEWFKILQPKHCKYWKPAMNGFVECTFLNRKAVHPSNQEDYEKGLAFFGTEERLNEEVQGFLLGDAVKECGLNHGGKDFAFRDLLKLRVLAEPFCKIFCPSQSIDIGQPGAKSLPPAPLLDGTGRDRRSSRMRPFVRHSARRGSGVKIISTNDGAPSRAVSHLGAKSQKSRRSFNSRRLHHFFVVG